MNNGLIIVSYTLSALYGILLSVSLLFGGLALTAMTLRTEDNEE